MANYMFKMFRHVKMHVWYVESHVTDMVLTCNMYRHVPLHGVFWWPTRTALVIIFRWELYKSAVWSGWLIFALLSRLWLRSVDQCGILEAEGYIRTHLEQYLAVFVFLASRVRSCSGSVIRNFVQLRIAKRNLLWTQYVKNKSFSTRSRVYTCEHSITKRGLTVRDGADLETGIRKLARTLGYHARSVWPYYFCFKCMSWLIFFVLFGSSKNKSPVLLCIMVFLTI